MDSVDHIRVTGRRLITFVCPSGVTKRTVNESSNIDRRHMLNIPTSVQMQMACIT
jgi:hypothetical protein